MRGSILFFIFLFTISDKYYVTLDLLTYGPTGQSVAARAERGRRLCIRTYALTRATWICNNQHAMTKEMLSLPV
jgi:hypothetical protein